MQEVVTEEYQASLVHSSMASLIDYCSPEVGFCLAICEILHSSYFSVQSRENFGLPEFPSSHV